MVVNVTSNNNVAYFSPEDKPYGISFGEWTIKWWKWALSIPKSLNPVLDQSGHFANMNQQGDVWFLAGTIGDDKIMAHRSCVIPRGKAVLFPVINYIYADDEKQDPVDLIKHVQKDIDDIVVNETIIDGRQVPGYRIKSDPVLFELDVIDENIMDMSKEWNKASADGYWVFMKPMQTGTHEIIFHGACSGGQRNAAANYKVIIE